jgi:hypothetical protein
MATRLGLSLVLLIGVNLTPARALAQGGDVDQVKNQFGLCRHRLRNLAAAVRERLDEAEAGAARVREQRRRLMDQTMAVSKADLACQEAKLKTQVAEVVVKEYEQGTVKQELETIEGNIAMSRAELKRAEDHLEESLKHVEVTKALLEQIGQMPKVTIGELMSEYYAGRNRKSAENEVEADKLRIDAARFRCEQAAVAKDVLVKYTKEIRSRQLRAEVEKARAEALAKEAELGLARDIEARIERHAQSIDNRALTPAEFAALDKFSALEKAWRAILARRGEIEKPDPAKRDELKKTLGDFAGALDETDRAWSSAREAGLDERDAATMTRVRRGPS